MSFALDTRKIVWDTFGGLEPPKPEWREQIGYWEDYARKFFSSNGMNFQPQDSNVEAWLMSEDRAPFVDMIGQLLPQLSAASAGPDTDAILFAHWLPDIHLGTSVTNFAMHKLGLKDSLGFAISDRGLSAPFFAFDSLYKYLRMGRRHGLLLIADQKHVMYRSDIVERLDPMNAACIVPIDLDSTQGLTYRGYARQRITAGSTAAECLSAITHDFGLSLKNTVFIGPEDVLRGLDNVAGKTATNDRLVCAAPFVAFSEVDDLHPHHVLVCRDGDRLTALGFQGLAT